MMCHCAALPRKLQNKLEGGTMKKLVLILVALTLAVGAFAGAKTEAPTAQPAPAQAAAKAPIKSPDTFIYASHGDIDSLDPAKAYDTASGGVLVNIYENLIQYDGASVGSFVPTLAEQVPTVENGGISKDGLTYRFKIRKGVKFHSGSTLTPEGVRYSFLRNMLTDPDGGPMWMLLEPLVGVSGTRDNAGKPIAALAEVARKAVTVDGDYVVFKLQTAFPPFLQVLCYNACSIVDMEFCIKNGDWDGKADTWQKWNNPPEGEAKLDKVASGTGPFKLERREVGTEVVLTRFDGYWGKKPAMAKAIYKVVQEWSTRKLMLLQGDADTVTVDPSYYSEMDKEPGLKVYRDLKALSVAAMNFNQKINTADNPYVYSGKLDGNGVPGDFFSDKDLRTAIIYAWDEKTYLKDIMAGSGADVATPIIDGLLYYNPEMVNKRPPFDLKKAEESFKKAWGGQVWEKGFKVDFLYNAGNEVRERAMKMLAENVMKVNPKFKVEVRGVEWATFVDLQRQKRLPIFYIGWGADYPDPHNFAQPYMFSQGLYGGRSGYKNAEADKLIEQGAIELDAAKRKAIYYRLQEIWLEDNPGIVFHQAKGNRYFRDWVQGFVFNPMDTTYFYNQFEKKY
jgi:peptide/nickel transport system substrate-binding protein